MTNCNAQIVEAYEKLDMTPEEISSQLEFELLTVKAILAQFSDKYRANNKPDSKQELDFRDDELVRANQIIANLAFYADDPNLQYRAAKYIRQDKKGRLDVFNKLRGLNFNATVFNIHLQQSNAAIEKARQKKVIDIPSEEAKMLQTA